MSKIAAYQGPVTSDPLAQLHQIMSRADVDIICFPECFLTGYFTNETEAREHSLDPSGLQGICNQLSQYSATIVVGFNERAGSKLFNSVAVIEKGKLLGIQRKHYLYHSYFSPGGDYQTFTSRGIAFGIIICLDAIYLEPARILGLRGADLIFCPMSNKVPISHPYATRPNYYSHFVARSFENRCWFVSSDATWPNDGEMICPGHSCIYSPNGVEMARSQAFQEELLIHDIEPSTSKGRRVLGSPILQDILQNLQPFDNQQDKKLSPETVII